MKKDVNDLKKHLACGSCFLIKNTDLILIHKSTTDRRERQLGEEWKESDKIDSYTHSGLNKNRPKKESRR